VSALCNTVSKQYQAANKLTHPQRTRLQSLSAIVSQSWTTIAEYGYRPEGVVDLKRRCSLRTRFVSATPCPNSIRPQTNAHTPKRTSLQSLGAIVSGDWTSIAEHGYRSEGVLDLKRRFSLRNAFGLCNTVSKQYQIANKHTHI
jgi:hypothetical protein